VLPLQLGQALVHAPREWAADIVRRVYPQAKVVEDNPRVNVLLRVAPEGGPIESVDARWDPALPERVGSVVVTYGGAVDKEALLARLQAVAKPSSEDEGERDWLLKDGGLRLSYYARDYEGRTRLAFEPVDLSGSAVSHPDDEMKRFPEWGAKRQRDDR